ncbi:MAG: class II aldolase/adducin family protein [Solirubrobacteraceae bacterium]|nr:class II aldolase/adducin family protein [Solirubrobacteraceae bacterium]
MLEREREQVAAAARKLAAAGLVSATNGNLSVRCDDLVAVSPTGAVLGELQAADVPVVDIEGAVRFGALAPTSELSLHLGVYRRFESGAVVHTHAPMATALACVLDELPMVHYEMLGLGGAVRVAPYATFGTPELAAGVLDALEGRLAALMANHGAVTHGPDLATALRATELLEWACTVYWRAAQLGTPRVLDDAAVQAVVAQVTTTGYGATRRAEGE